MPLDSKLRLLVDAEAIVAIGKLSDSSNALSSSSLSEWATISPYVPFSRPAASIVEAVLRTTGCQSYFWHFHQKHSRPLGSVLPKRQAVSWYWGQKKPKPFMFCLSVRFRFHVFSPEDYQQVLQGLAIYWIDVPECLQSFFSQQWVKMIDFQLFGLCWLHFYHCMKRILKEFKFFALSVERPRSGLNWSGRHWLWFILEVEQYVSQSVYRTGVFRAPQALGLAEWCPERHRGWILVSSGSRFSSGIQSAFCRWVSVASVTI